MTHTLKSPTYHFCSILILFLLLSCTHTEKPVKVAGTNDSLKTLPPQCTEAFALPSLLSDEARLTGPENIEALLSKPWYASISVQNARQSSVTSLDNCSAYFDNTSANLRAERDNEQNAFLELKLACEASRLLMKAEDSVKSFLPHPLFTEETPHKLPKSVALITSQKEFLKVQDDASTSRWSEVNTIRHFEEISPIQAFYTSESGVQKLSEVGRGDINHDGIQDILLLSEDSVEGGSYFNLRLFVLTVSDDGLWLVLEQY